MMGAERRSLAMSDEEKKLTAYHEGGHALVALHVEGSDPIHKATIIPRGRALGMVMRLPERDQLSLTRQKMMADLCVAFGGRIAEELIFGHDKVTTGAQSDIEQATRMARAMVTRFGMSDELGPIAYGENQEEVFLGPQRVAHAEHLGSRRRRRSMPKSASIIDTTYQPGEGHPDQAPRRSAHAGAGTAGIRDADGRRDRGAAEGHSAGAHAVRGAGSARRPPPSQRADGRPAARPRHSGHAGTPAGTLKLANKRLKRGGLCSPFFLNGSALRAMAVRAVSRLLALGVLGILAVLGIDFGIALARQLGQPEQVGLFFAIPAISITLILLVLAHECGHAVAAFSLRWRLFLFTAWRLTIKFDPFRVYWGSSPFAGAPWGAIAALPATGPICRSEWVTVLAGGVTANLFITLLAGIFLVQNHAPLFTSVWILVRSLSLSFLVSNLIPNLQRRLAERWRASARCDKRRGSGST